MRGQHNNKIRNIYIYVYKYKQIKALTDGEKHMRGNKNRQIGSEQLKERKDRNMKDLFI